MLVDTLSRKRLDCSEYVIEVKIMKGLLKLPLTVDQLSILAAVCKKKRHV
jgi:hypothetical protein